MRHAWRKRRLCRRCRTRAYGASRVHTRYQVCRMRRRAFVFTRIVFNERARNTVTCVRMLPSQRRGLLVTGWLALLSLLCRHRVWWYDAPTKFHYATANTSRINFISRFGYFVRLYKINLVRMRLLDDTRTPVATAAANLFQIKYENSRAQRFSPLPLFLPLSHAHKRVEQTLEIYINILSYSSRYCFTRMRFVTWWLSLEALKKHDIFYIIF